MLVIWTAQNGYLDQVPVARVKEFQNKSTELLHHAQKRIAGPDREGKSDQRRVEGGVKDGRRRIQADLEMNPDW